MSASPFHTGEQQVQHRVGVRDQIEPWARRVIRGHLPEQHREFYSQLPFVVAAARDALGRPWATLLVGSPGFIQSPDDRGLTLATRPLVGDALEASLSAGTDLGLLGIELETRRRNRVNGTIVETGSEGMRLAVGQTFGNCPQYITERQWRSVNIDTTESRVHKSDRLDANQRDWIATADTLFIASGYRGNGRNSESNGMDASHRGGAPGFVEVIDHGRLLFPDYAGNNHFNTIGNLVMEPDVGLLFVDFDRGAMLQITGRASIDWDSEAVALRPGAQRLVTIEIDAIVQLDGVLPLRWSDPSGSIRSLKVKRKIRESQDVVSFEFAARDGGALPDFEAGQHLPIELNIDGTLITRTYSLSNGPGEDHYRISVKREPRGRASRWLHDRIEEGDIIAARPPTGEFVLRCTGRPKVLISAGIGVTPMVSMLHQLVRTCAEQPVHFFHVARNSNHHALARETRTLAENHDQITLDIAYSQPLESDVQGVDFNRPGRLSGESVADRLDTLDADYYLCGPVPFMNEIVEALNQRGVKPDCIHYESFGSS